MSRTDYAYQHAVEAEEALIKGVLDLRSELDTPNYISALEPEAFLDESHRIMWKALQIITDKGGLIDSWAVEKIMAKLGGDESNRQVCERYFLSQQGNTSDLRPRVAVVSEAYKRRTLANAMARLSERAITEDLRTIESEFAELTGKVAQAGNPKLRAGTDYAQQFEAFLSGRPILPEESRDNLIITGSQQIDSTIVANPGRLIVIGGLPSAGKTALAVQAAVRTAIAGRRVALGSLEMDEDEISARIVACACGVNSLRVLRHGGKPCYEDREILTAVRRNLVGIHGCAGDSWSSLEAAIVREHRRSPLSLAILDYLQLMEAPELKKRLDSEAQRIGEITKSAKRLAQRLKINVLILSQFNRDVKECEEPSLQNFLGSGQIERDIDIALLLWNTEKNPLPGAQHRIVNCRVAKNRGGERYAKIRMKFNPGLNRFEDDERTTEARFEPAELELGS